MLLNMPTRWGAGRGPDTEHVRDQLSAYIDYELPDAERVQVREHLRRCPECENELATLKAMKQLLIETALRPVPRSFALTPEMVGRTARGPVVAPPRRGWSLAGRLRLATAGVAMLLAVMVTGDALFLSYGSPTASIAMPSDQALAPAPDTYITGSTASGAAAAPTSTTAAAMASANEAGPAATTGAAPPSAPDTPPQLMITTAPAAGTPGAAAAPGGFGGAVDATQDAYTLTTGFQYQRTGTSTQGLTGVDKAVTLPAGVMSQPLNPWRLVEGALLILVLVLGVGSLWAARQRV
jgi:hypothetical protein